MRTSKESQERWLEVRDKIQDCLFDLLDQAQTNDHIVFSCDVLLKMSCDLNKFLQCGGSMVEETVEKVILHLPKCKREG